MTIVFAIQHPAHVHLFRNSIQQLSNTEEVEVVVREKEIAVELLRAYEIEHSVLAAGSSSVFNLPLDYLIYEYNMWKHVKKIDPRVFVGVGGVAISHVATLTRSKAIVFHDTEHTKFQNNIAFPFVDKMYTPDCYQEDLGSKQIRYPGYHELAYLHPNRFEPDPSRLREEGIDPNETYSVVRFIGFQASHDIGQSGLSFSAKQEIVSMLDEIGDAYISSEKSLPNEFKEYEIDIPPHLIHDLLFYADYYIGDSGTMATEAAVLGTPAIRCSSFVESNNAGVFRELEEKYHLLFSTSSEVEAVSKLDEFIDDPNIHQKQKMNRDRLLADKIDVTEFIVDQITEMIQ